MIGILPPLVLSLASLLSDTSESFRTELTSLRSLMLAGEFSDDEVTSPYNPQSGKPAASRNYKSTSNYLRVLPVFVKFVDKYYIINEGKCAKSQIDKIQAHPNLPESFVIYDKDEKDMIEKDTEGNYHYYWLQDTSKPKSYLKMRVTAGGHVYFAQILQPKTML